MRAALRYGSAARPFPRSCMFPKPMLDLKPNTYAFEVNPLVKPTGFREYDARWLFGQEINLMGVTRSAWASARYPPRLGVRPRGRHRRTTTGPIPASIKTALITGLMASGCRVHDIGLAMTPMAYFAQFDLDVPCRRHGHRLAQRERLDRRQDGRRPADHLRPR